jgi:hypothetical protein
MRKSLGCLGLLIVAISLFFVIAAVSELITGSPPDDPTPAQPGVLWALIIFFATIAAGGGFMVKTFWGKDKKELELKKKEARERERKILALIARKNGRITPIELAAESDVTIDEAKEFLDSLCGKAGGELMITDDGDLVYVFPVMSDEKKANAKDPFES